MTTQAVNPFTTMPLHYRKNPSKAALDQAFFGRLLGDPQGTVIIIYRSESSPTTSDLWVAFPSRYRDMTLTLAEFGQALRIPKSRRTEAEVTLLLEAWFKVEKRPLSAWYELPLPPSRNEVYRDGNSRALAINSKPSAVELNLRKPTEQTRAGRSLTIRLSPEQAQEVVGACLDRVKLVLDAQGRRLTVRPNGTASVRPFQIELTMTDELDQRIDIGMPGYMRAVVANALLLAIKAAQEAPETTTAAEPSA